MPLINPVAARPLNVGALLAACAMAATALVAVTPERADAATPCRIDVTTRLDKTSTFAGQGVSKYYWTTAKGSQVGQYDHKANVIMTRMPAGAVPQLVNMKIGERIGVGEMTKRQRPEAVASINGDFFIAPDIRYENTIEMARGVMVRNGNVLRATAQRQRVVGLTRAGLPFAGMMGVRGSVQAQVPDAPKVDVKAINWHRVVKGGVTIYTTEWSGDRRGDGKATYPRPAGKVEWVMSGGEITQIRSAQRNSGKRGDPVADGTRVIAFSGTAVEKAKGAPVGTTVTVNTRQSTDTGVSLQTGVGRGLPIVENGKPAPLGCRDYAKTGSAVAARPRMFVGWDAQGRWRSFAVPGSKLEVINGVTLRTGGLGLANAANVAAKLGMTYAYELDGGGSTTLYTRKSGDWTRKDLYKVRNPTNCDCERWMANGLAFVQP